MTSRVQVCLLVLLIATPLLLTAQSSDHIIIIQPVKHDTSPQLSDLLPGSVSHDRHEVPLFKPNRPGGGGGGGGSFTDPVLQSSVNASLAGVSVVQKFDGQGNDSDAYAPPDTNGAAGTYQYVQTVNVQYAAYDKSTHSIVSGPAPINTIWSGFGGSCQTSNGGDPIIQFDKINLRWVIMQIQYSGFGSSGGNFLCIAVSNGDDWTKTGFAFQRYAYQFNNLTDYPKMGIWTDAYYVTYNAFKGFGTFAGPVVCALDLAQAGATGKVGCFSLSTSFSSLLPADVDSINQQPISGEPEYLVALGGSPLWTWRYHLDLAALRQGTQGTSTLSAAKAATVSASLAYQLGCGGGTCIPQSGTTQQLDSLGDRLMYRLAYRNFGSSEYLVVNHSVTASSSSTKTGIRWYQLGNTPSNNYLSPTAPSVVQAGTYAPDSNYRWMGSAAMDAAGNIAVGYSVSSSSMHPSISIADRCLADTAGQLRPEVSVQTGGGSQTGNLNRWGDYSGMSIDPVDGSLWYTTEYLQSNGSFNWHTKIVNFTNSCP